MARVVAILAVIAIHVVSPLLSNRGHIHSWWYANVIDSLARWSVPVFVMISGWLLLHSELADDPLAFYRRRLARLLPVLVAWSVIYLVYGHIMSNNPRTLRDAFNYLLAGRPWFHLYFLYLIAGLYLVAPFLRPLVTHPNRRVLGAAVLVFLALGMADLFILVWRGLGGVNAITRFVPYIGYFLAGAYLRDLPPTKRKVIAATVTAGVGMVATALGTWLLVGAYGLGRGRYLYEYLSLTTVPVSIAVFALFMWSAPWMDRLAARVPGRAVAVVASTTLGIYVIHPLVLGRLSALGLNVRTSFVPVSVPFMVLAAFVISLLVVLVIRAVPGVRRLV